MDLGLPNPPQKRAVAVVRPPDFPKGRAPPVAQSLVPLRPPRCLVVLHTSRDPIDFRRLSSLLKPIPAASPYQTARPDPGQSQTSDLTSTYPSTWADPSVKRASALWASPSSRSCCSSNYLSYLLPTSVAADEPIHDFNLEQDSLDVRRQHRVYHHLRSPASSRNWLFAEVSAASHPAPKRHSREPVHCPFRQRQTGPLTTYMTDLLSIRTSLPIGERYTSAGS
ncbi:hypothetical protein BJ166DRAFT_501353 [Pestalotiopsis sp. NC0098]|nr:hypothetical protein BJ166DRAFT_501353 [Pestalotiopsis sp. NC0098]